MKKNSIPTILTILFAASFFACQPRLRTLHFILPPAEISPQKPTQKPPGNQACCADYRNYIPDPAHPDHSPMRYLRLNVHVMDSTRGTQNFQPGEAQKFIGALLDSAIFHLDHNQRMWLPFGNQTPVLPPRYQYLRPDATDWHFHRDDSLYFYVVKGRNQNNYDRRLTKKYNVGGDSIINLFFMPHHPDSQLSKRYTAGFQGIALGNSVKAAGVFENRKLGPNALCGLVNHEIGHVLGLGHSWLEDGCDDTPNHPQNCWSWTPEPPCNSQAYNNVMDYAAASDAWTPCQIGRVQMNLAYEKSVSRRALLPVWCELDERQTIVIRDSVHWAGSKDLNGHLKIADGGVLKISCRISMPPGGKITVEPGGRLILDGCRIHQACGKIWKGIDYQRFGEKTGQVEIVGSPVLENLE